MNIDAKETDTIEMKSAMYGLLFIMIAIVIENDVFLFSIMHLLNSFF